MTMPMSCVMHDCFFRMCSGRDLNPSFGLERAASLTGLDDQSVLAVYVYMHLIVFAL